MYENKIKWPSAVVYIVVYLCKLTLIKAKTVYVTLKNWNIGYLLGI